ncbi:unnamed protein product [Parnassius apollo]|uniref:(apollo) hypothetical protein n=1 Tax=Parnassius apollo TaxID=110799 RepID=A0A8S3YEQ9_PARAO|nr:unnamed protein product [Parnassius apollo]
MFPSTIKVYIIFLIVFLLQSTAYGQHRTITSKLNPGCKDCGLNSTLIYVKAEGLVDTIHQIWDFTQGIPTMILAVGSGNSSIDINWSGSKPMNFSMLEKPHYSYATAIDKIYEYNDLEDIGAFDVNRPYRIQSLKNVSWELKESVLTSKKVMVRLRGTLRDKEGRGTVEMKLEYVNFTDYARTLPHLIHNANNTLVDISLVNLTTSRHFNSSRFAVHLVLVSEDLNNLTMHSVTRKSLDDEHTPGVFEIIEINSPRLWFTGSGGFLQFRPVAYVESQRNVASSTLAHVSNFTKTSLPQWSTLETFYEGYDKMSLLVQDLVVSFGEPGDGFYKQHNYTAWSYTLGYGWPPAPSLSLMGVMIISLGITVLMALLGAGCVMFVMRCWCRKTTSPSHPSHLTDEDSLERRCNGFRTI